MPTDPTMVAAFRDANAAQLREDAAVCATSALFCTHLDEASRYRRLAALALAVARMQELAEREASKVGYNPREVRWTVDSDGDTHWHDAHMYSEVPRTLPAALSAMLSDE